MSPNERFRLARAAFTGLLLLSGAAGFASPPASDLRLDPVDITALTAGGSGVGTSGVKGIRTTVLSGNPGSAGPYTISLSVPANTRISAHSHRDTRFATVVSGVWWFGYGSLLLESLLKPLLPGSFYTEPAGEPHFARTGTQAVVVYITGFGPSDNRYVDAASDPRKR